MHFGALKFDCSIDIYIEVSDVIIPNLHHLHNILSLNSLCRNRVT